VEGAKAAFAAAGRLSPDYIVAKTGDPADQPLCAGAGRGKWRARLGCESRMCFMPETANLHPLVFMTAPSQARKRSRWISPCASNPLRRPRVRLPESMEWVGRSSRRWV